MTKEEAKQKIAAIIEKVEGLQDDLMALEDEAFYAYHAVKPYDGRYLLTMEQENMKELFWKLRFTATEAKYVLIGIENYFALLDDQTTQEG